MTMWSRTVPRFQAVLAACALAILLAGTGAPRAQTLDDLLSDRGGSGGLMGTLGQILDGASNPDGSALPDLNRALEDLGAGQPGLFGGILTPDASRVPPAMPQDPALADEAHDRDLALARQCTSALGTEIPGFLVDPILDGFERSEFGNASGIMPMARGALSVLRSFGTPCASRDVLILEAMLDALASGRYNRSRRTLEALVPRQIDPDNALALLAQASLASVMALQLREDEAQALLDKLSGAFEQRFGGSPNLPLALAASRYDLETQLAESARIAGRADEADRRFSNALDGYRDVEERIVARLGDAHELACLVRVAEVDILVSLSRVEEAEEIGRALLNGDCRRALDDDNLATAGLLEGLGRVAMSQGRLARAESDLSQGLRIAEALRSGSHPDVVRIKRSLVELRMLQGREADALSILADMDDRMFDWLGGELRGYSSLAQRRRVAASQLDHQDLALLVARAAPDNVAAQSAAANAVLRFKGIQGEEDALLQRIVRRAADNPDLARLARRVSELRSDLATGFAARPGTVASMSTDLGQKRVEELARAEGELQRRSGQFQAQLAVRSVQVGDVQRRLAKIAAGATLVEYRLVRDRRLGALETGREREVWVAIVVEAGRIRTVEMADARVVRAHLDRLADPKLQQFLLAGDPAGRFRLSQFMTVLWQLLIQPLDLAAVSRLFIAPEGELNLVPFYSLRRADGALWISEIPNLAILPSGRALLSEATIAPGGGIAFFGDIDYGSGADDSRELRALSATRTEITSVEAIAARAGLTVTKFLGDEASEAALTSLDPPPGILHLATHGFYEETEETPDRPSILAGLALAGANKLVGPFEDAGDGILYAIEAQGLNLEGTRLVVLSACESALGAVERGEAVHSLARAFRVAGAGYSLVAMKKIPDEGTADLIERFYAHLIGSAGATPEDAFREVVLEVERDAASLDTSAFTLVRNY